MPRASISSHIAGLGDPFPNKPRGSFRLRQFCQTERVLGRRNFDFEILRQKRGGQAEKITLEENLVASTNHSQEIIALDEALKQLEALNVRKVRVVEMKFFGGLTTEEITEVLKVSPETVKRDWKFARTRLLRELAEVK